MTTAKEHGIPNVIEIVLTDDSGPAAETLAALLSRAGGPVVMKQGEMNAVRGRAIRISVSSDADIDSADTEVTFELV